MSRFGQGIGPIIGLGVILLGSTYLMSIATQDSARFGQLYSALLAFNAIALLGLGTLIARNLYRLLRQVRERRPGAKLTVRMVVVFVVLSVTPVTVVYYFSLQFLHRGIDSWFDVRIQGALDDALDLSRTALGVRMRELLAQTARIASDLGLLAAEEAVAELDDARLLSGASELTLIGANGPHRRFEQRGPHRGGAEPARRIRHVSGKRGRRLHRTGRDRRQRPARASRRIGSIARGDGGRAPAAGALPRHRAHELPRRQRGSPRR